MKISLGRVTALATVPVLLFALGAGSASAQPASGSPPPPSGFEADSASFVSAQTGFVLGARGCSRLPCTARLVKTTNGGRTWSAVHAPAVSLVPPSTTTPLSAVSTVRFASSSDGWLYNPGLWATTNGGRTWQRIELPGTVGALAASDGVAFASVTPASGGTPRLYESLVGTGRWSLVPGVAPGNSLAVSGHSGWAGTPPNLWATTDSGRSWHKLSFRCPPGRDASGVAAASPASIALVCFSPAAGSSAKAVFVSSNGGRTFREAGQAPPGGIPRLLAMPPYQPQLMTLAASNGASFLDRSVNGGRTWQQVTYSDGGLGWRDLAYVSATTGYLVHFGGGPVIAYSQGLMKTTNAGARWQTVAIP